MAFGRTIISIVFIHTLLMKGVFTVDNPDATDGEEYIKKLFSGKDIPEKPEYLLFTAPYKICANGCTGADKLSNFAMAFPMFLGKHGKDVYKNIYPNDNRNEDDIFKTKRPTRGPFTTCGPQISTSVTANRNTKSTMYPGFSFVVNTKSTGFPDYQTFTTPPPYNPDKFRKTRSTGYYGYSEITKRTQSTRYNGYNVSTKATLSTWIPDFEDFKSTRKLSALGYRPFRTTRDSALFEYENFINDPDVLRTRRVKPPGESIYPKTNNQFQENGADYSLKPEQEYTDRKSITPDSRESQSKLRQWLQNNMIRKTISNIAPTEPPLMRRVAPLRREPENYPDSRTHNDRSLLGLMPVYPNIE